MSFFFLILESSEFALDGEALLAFLDVAYDLCVNVERLREGNDLICHLRTYVDFHAVSHVEYLVHFLPVCARTIVNGTEQRRNGEHIVLDDAAVVVDEVEHLGLGTTCAMYHTMNLRTQLVEQALDDRRIGAGGGKDELASVDGRTVNHAIQLILAAIDEIVRHGVVEALRVFLGQILGEDIVAGGGQTIGAHTTVVALLVPVLWMKDQR